MTYKEAINTIEHGCIYRDKQGGEALEIAVTVLKKQIPKKPRKTRNEIVCPTCNILVGSSPYCRYCGQALDWSDIMPDKEITREKTFSEELPHFKERIEEVFDNYNNPNGNEDPLYINVLRDSKRIVRKAEKEITYQQADIRMLRKKVNLVSIQFQDLQEKTDKIKVEAYKEFAEKIKKSIKENINEAWHRDDGNGIYDAEYVLDNIDNILKEMLGEE